MSELGQASGVDQGRSLQKPPERREGPVLVTPTPHHSGTDENRKGGPLWLQIQGYVLPATLCQDHLPVSTTGVLVTTRTGFHLQVSALIGRPADGQTAGSAPGFATSYGGSRRFQDLPTVARKRSPVSAVRCFG